MYKSLNRGSDWSAISPDLTKNYAHWDEGFGISNGGVTPEYTGAEVAGTISTIAESPLKKGMLWVGTDDGNVQLTKDDGNNWLNLTNNIKGVPKDLRVSSIVASSFSEGRAYLTFDGHSLNNFSTYVFVTEDYGKSWTKLNNNLPADQSCNTIREGLKNPDLLFLGTETNLWVSLNRGKSWSKYKDWKIEYSTGYLPTVAVQSMEIHPRDLDLIVGTHGRSVYILPVRSLEELTATNLAKDVYFVSPNTVYRTGKVYRNSMFMTNLVVEPTPTRALFQYYLKEGAKGEVNISIFNASGDKVTTLKGSANSGLNSIYWEDVKAFNYNHPRKNLLTPDIIAWYYR